jgi:hypothetical protein
MPEIDLDAISEACAAALSRLPAIKPDLKSETAKTAFAALRDDLSTIRRLAGGQDGGGGGNGDGQPSGSWKITLDDLGGPAGSGGRKVVSGETFSDPGWMKQANTDYVECTLTGEALQSDQIAERIRLINATFKSLKPWAPGGSNSTFGFYINLGKQGELRHGLVIFGGKVIGLKATEFMETKGFDPKIIGLDLTESPEIEGGIRVRHGAEALIVGCPGLKQVTLRGHHHGVVDCPQATVRALAGNLPGEFSKWRPMRPPGHGAPAKLQRAERCYAADVKIVLIGDKTNETVPFPALACMVSPGQARQLLAQEGFRECVIGGADELRRAP